MKKIIKILAKKFIAIYDDPALTEPEILDYQLFYFCNITIKEKLRKAIKSERTLSEQTLAKLTVRDLQSAINELENMKRNRM